MDSDGEGSDGRPRRLGEDEYELPRVIWVPDSVESQQDFLRKSRKEDTFRALPCTQTTESSRLLRNTSGETSTSRCDGTVTEISSGTVLFTTDLDQPTPRGRRPTRKIRSLPSPYSAPGPAPNTGRRSTIDGTSKTHGSVLTSSTRPTSRSLDPTALASTSGSPSDRLGSLMTQLGERFSNRTEARKRRAEAQEKLALQKQQTEVLRLQRGKQEAEDRARRVQQAGTEVLRRPMSTTRAQLPIHEPSSRSGPSDVKRCRIETSSKPAVSTTRPRHPLAQTDVNHTADNAALTKTYPGGLEPNHQKPGNTPFLTGRNVPVQSKPPQSNYTGAIHPHSTVAADQGLQIHPSVQSPIISASSRANNAASFTKTFPSDLGPNYQKPVNTSFLTGRNVVVQTKPSPLDQPGAIHPRATAPPNQGLLVQPPIISTTHPLPTTSIHNPAPLYPVDPETETGTHHNSDTSFDSLTDIDGLFSGGGEDVEALFRACDGL